MAGVYTSVHPSTYRYFEKYHVEIELFFLNSPLTQAKKLVYIFFTFFCSPVIWFCFDFPLEGGLEIPADLIHLAED